MTNRIRYVIASLIILSVGMGVGFGITAALFLVDHPTIIVETKWKTVTTAPPVTYLPETPFNMDLTTCADYVPTTTTTLPVPSTTSTVPAPVIPTPTTQTTQPPSTPSPSSTTSTPETTASVPTVPESTATG